MLKGLGCACNATVLLLLSQHAGAVPLILLGPQMLVLCGGRHEAFFPSRRAHASRLQIRHIALRLFFCFTPCLGRDSSIYSYLEVPKVVSKAFSQPRQGVRVHQLVPRSLLA